MAAVHYLRFVLPPEAQAAVPDPARSARLVVDHPNYKVEASIPAEVRQEMLKDLSS